MKQMLQKSQCRVIFTKVNGEERNMVCTLKEGVIPKASKDPITQKKIRDLNEEVLAVWDVKAEGWRSFRVANVVSFICD